MNNFTAQQYLNAKKKLPQALQDFLSSDDIDAIYNGIREKHSLTLPQFASLTRAASAILIKLEPESALEAKLHQELPALQSGVLRELVEDVKDRVFKEAARRVRENIITSKPEGEAATVFEGPVPTAEEIDREIEEAETRVRTEQYAATKDIIALAERLPDISAVEKRTLEENARLVSAQEVTTVGTPLPTLSELRKQAGAMKNAVDYIQELAQKEEALHEDVPESREVARISLNELKGSGIQNIRRERDGTRPPSGIINWPRSEEPGKGIGDKSHG
jgi:hypothetical protein